MMKQNAIILSLILSFLAFAPFKSHANQLPECNTSECIEYFKAYRILTKRGHSSAMAMLGELYYSGYGTDKDLDMALKWYRRAGKYGVLDAKYKAGVLYLQDTPLKDVDEGIDFLKYASKLGHAQSSFLLGKIYLGGGMVEQDLALADQYLARAYEENNLAARNYGQILYLHESTKDLPFSKLYALISQDVVQLNPQGTDKNIQTAAVVFPQGEMETIDVQMDTFEDMFGSHIAQLNHMLPDTSKGTGSNIAGQTCARMWGCSSEGDGQRIQDVMLSDWGLETLQFRLIE
ncbi:tetratricopeptide repeat protein [Shewanella frigidimarina]|uniref:Sel1 domain protein repeat-containing protein n=1 Tax=Shewanella frigidimarina (strain NCIMB 400) TaxID=318167 RepID=Q07Y29_SHEFN|nr:tetratricopeptide repeat protein [Shewanella frigidimarina]ABI73085.1 Sel1 domain protein repeat-containing protein [Shewanella frigidimarina NCIMB 400]